MGGLTAYLLVGGFAFRWEALPFQYMIAGPPRLAMSQAVWIVVFGLVCNAVYRMGVTRVDVNGG